MDVAGPHALETPTIGEAFPFAPLIQFDVLLIRDDRLIGLHDSGGAGRRRGGRGGRLDGGTWGERHGFAPSLASRALSAAPGLALRRTSASNCAFDTSRIVLTLARSASDGGVSWP